MRKTNARLLSMMLAGCAAFGAEAVETSEVTKAKEEAAIAKARAEIATAEKTMRDARTPPVTALTGETTINDNVKIESEVLGYQAAEEIAKRIAKDVNGLEPSVIVLHDAATYSALSLYENFLIQLQFLERAYDSASEEIHAASGSPKSLMVGPALLDAAGFARAAIDLVSLFRQNTDYKGRSVDVKEHALAAQVAYYLRFQRPCLTVIYPKLLFTVVEQLNEGRIQQSRLYKRLAGLAERRDSASARIAAAAQLLDAINKQGARHLELKKANFAQPEIENDPVYKFWKRIVEELGKGITGAELRRAEAYKTANALYDSFLGALTTIKDTTGTSPLTLILQAERLVSKLEADKAYSLRIDFNSGGGTYEIRRTLWDIFAARAKMRYSGGAIVSYALLDKHSNIVLSRSLSYVTGFTKFSGRPPSSSGRNW